MAFLSGLRPFVTAATLTIVASPLLAEPASFMAPVPGTETVMPAEIAGDNVLLALIREMFDSTQRQAKSASAIVWRSIQ